MPQAFSGYPAHSTGDPPPDEETGEGSDAWEAAQNILKAINFGALIQFGRSDKDAGDITVNGATEDIAGHPPPVTASMDMDVMAVDQTGVVEPGQAVEVAVRAAPAQLNADDRAALQAQLALLAAQMAELAEGEADVLTHGLGTAIGVPTTEIKAVENECGMRHDNEPNDGDDDQDMELVPVP